MVVVGLAVLVSALVLCGCAPVEESPSASEQQPSASSNLETKSVGKNLGLGVFLGAIVLGVSFAAGLYLNQLRRDGEGGLSGWAVVGGSLGIFLVLSLGWWMFGSYVSVEAGHVGVVVRQGQPRYSVRPGAHFVAPYIENVVLFPTRTWTYATMTDPTKGNEDYRDWSVTMVTRDGVNVKVNYTIQGTLDPASVIAVLEKYGTLENAIAQAVKFPSRVKVRYILREFSADDLLASLDDMEGAVVGYMQPIMAEAGLTMGLFGFRKPTLGIDGAYEAQLDAAQTAIKEELTEKAKVGVERQLSLKKEETARGNKLDVIQQAEGTAQSTKVTADADAYEVKAAADAEAYKIETEAKAQAWAIAEINRTLASNPDYLEYMRILAWKEGGAKVPQVVGVEAPGIWTQLVP